MEAAIVAAMQAFVGRGKDAGGAVLNDGESMDVARQEALVQPGPGTTLVGAAMHGVDFNAGPERVGVGRIKQYLRDPRAPHKHAGLRECCLRGLP